MLGLGLGLRYGYYYGKVVARVVVMARSTVTVSGNPAHSPNLKRPH